MSTNFGEDLRMLDVETFEIEDINDIGIDAPAIAVDQNEEIAAESSSSCSCSSCCSCSTSSCCSCSTSCGSCG